MDVAVRLCAPLPHLHRDSTRDRRLCAVCRTGVDVYDKAHPLLTLTPATRLEVVTIADRTPGTVGRPSAVPRCPTTRSTASYPPFERLRDRCMRMRVGLHCFTPFRCSVRHGRCIRTCKQSRRMGCTRTGLAPSTSGTGLTPPRSAPGLGLQALSTLLQSKRGSWAMTSFGMRSTMESTTEGTAGTND
jgi:hypothetical protein